MRTRDGYEIKEGMWVSDVNGIYEVSQIHGDNTATVNEIHFFGETGSEYRIVDTLTKTREEIERCDSL